MRAARARGALLADLSLLVATAAVAALAGCGSAASDAPSTHPFGTPPPAAADVHAWAAGEVGTLLVTDDGGASWQRKKFYLSARGLDVAFPDVRTGWLITDAGGVLRTTDGGSGWHVVDVSKLQLKAIAATDATHAWVVGAAGAELGEAGRLSLQRTSDGGQTWTRSRFGDAMLADVAFADARHGVLVALDRIWTTRDGGRSWKMRRRVNMSVLTSAFAGDARHAWVAGWGTQDGTPFVLATVNGGATWRRLGIDVPASSPGSLQVGQIVAAGEGTATAGTSPGQTSLWLTCGAGVLASADAGKTWELQQTRAGAPTAIAAADGKHLLATTDGQPVLATSDGGTTWLAFGSDGFLKQPLVSVAAVSAPAGE